MFINRPIYGCGSSLMCQTDSTGVSTMIQRTSVACPSKGSSTLNVSINKDKVVNIVMMKNIRLTLIIHDVRHLMDFCTDLSHYFIIVYWMNR